MRFKKNDFLLIYYSSNNGDDTDAKMKKLLFEFSVLIIRYVDNVVFILDCCNPWTFPIPHKGYVQLNSATFDQNSYEVTVSKNGQDVYCGAFTYFLCKELLNNTDVTYKTLIKNISDNLSNRGIQKQQPQIINFEDKSLFTISNIEMLSPLPAVHMVDSKTENLEKPILIDISNREKLPDDKFQLKENAQIIFEQNKKQIDEQLLAGKSIDWSDFVTNVFKPLWINQPQEYIYSMLRRLIIGRLNGTAPHPSLVKKDYDKFFTHFGTNIIQMFRVLLELHTLDCFIGFEETLYAKDMLSRPSKEARKGLYLCRTSGTPYAFVFCVCTDKGMEEFRATPTLNGLYNFAGKELKLSQIPEQFSDAFKRPYGKYTASIGF